jgi:TPR repeat protein
MLKVVDVIGSRWLLRAALPVVAVVCLLGTTPSMADTWDDVVASHLAGDDTTAHRLALKLAREGDARAQGFVGFLYLYGKGVQKDREEALKWYQLASEQGDAAAQSNLCAELRESTNAEDLANAVHWCKLSAAQGHQAGLFQLAGFYLYGRGVEQDLVEAYVWLSLAMATPGDSGLQSKAAYLRSQVKEHLAAEDLVEAERRISDWRMRRP